MTRHPVKVEALPEDLRDQVIDGWREFTDLLRECWDALAQIMTHLGSPSTLWATADAWSSGVGEPVSGQVQMADAAIAAGMKYHTSESLAAAAYVPTESGPVMVPSMI